MLSSLNQPNVDAPDEEDQTKRRSKRRKSSRRDRDRSRAKSVEHQDSTEAGDAKAADSKPEESMKKRRKRKKRGKEQRRGSDELAPLLSSYDLSYVIDREDVEAQRVALNSSETISFVQSLQEFGNAIATDYFGGSVKSQAQAGKSGFTEYYLESVSTGRFKRIVTKLDGNGHAVLQGKRESAKEEHNPENLGQIMNVVDYLISSFFLVCEGVLTGAALFESIIVFQVADERTFLQIYSPIALELRRLFYFLSVLAFVGSCDKLEAEYCSKKQWAARGSRERSELYFYVFFYLLTLLISLVAGPHADEMANTYILRQGDGSRWIDELLGSSTLNLTTWRNLVVSRFVFSMIGWLLLCKDIHRDLYRGRISRMKHQD